MRFCISCGIFEIKYFFYCILFSIIEIYFNLFIYYDFGNNDINTNIITNHNLLESSCLFLGYLLNIIPEWYSQKESKKKSVSSELKGENNKNTNFIKYIYNKSYNEYLSIKESLKFVFISLFLLLIEIFRQIQQILYRKINRNSNTNTEINEPIFEYDKFEGYFYFIQFLIYFSIRTNSEVYYKHQNFSFGIFFLIEFIKIIFFFIKNLSNKWAIIVIQIIISILHALYFIYIKGLMKYKFVSPYKCNFIIGIIYFPLIIIIYVIISFTKLGEKNKNVNINIYYWDSISELFKSINNINVINAIRLISLPIVYGIYFLVINKTIYDFTIYHLYIPLLIENFIRGTIEKEINIFLLITFFCIEFIMILIFLEIIEINFCGLNENLKRNIESRGRIDSSLTIEDDDDELDDKRKTINNNENKE